MNAFAVGVLPEVCRGILQVGIRLLLTSLVLCLLGMVSGYLLRRQGGAVRALVYKAAFGAILLSGLLIVSGAGRVTPLWSLSLPPTQESALPVPTLPEAVHDDHIDAAVSAPSLSSSAPEGAGVRHDNRGQKVLISLYPGVQASSEASEALRSPDAAMHLAALVSSPSLPPRAWLYIGIVSVWLGGTLLLLAWLGIHQFALLRLKRTSHPVKESALIHTLQELCGGMALTPPYLVISPQVSTPFLAGLWRPTIFLPTDWESQFEAAALRAILAHELSHLQRRDCEWNLMVRLLSALLWIQPMVWLLSRQWEQVSEEVCDQAVLAQNCSPRAYADCLLTLAERLGASGSEPALGMGIIAFRSSLGQRIQLILTPTRQARRLSTRQRVGIGIGALVAGVLVPGLVAATAAPPQETWAKDARLNRKAAITAEGIPLRDLLAQVSKQSGIVLRADDYVADDKVLLFTPARPLRDTLEDLAALYNDTWLPQTAKDGTVSYRLIRDVRARGYEDGLARETINRMLAQLDQQVKALSETPEQLAKRPADDPIRKRLSDRDGRMATSFYALLSPAQRDTLFAQDHLVVPYSALTPEQQEPLRQQFEEKREREKDSIAHDPSLLSPQWLQESGLRFLLDLSGGVLHAKVGFSYGHITLTKFGAIEIAAIDSRSGVLLPPHGDPYTGKRVPMNAPLPRLDAIQEAQSKADWTDRLLKLAEKSGQPILADYYRCRPLERPTAVTASATGKTKEDAFSVLDAFCQPAGYLWWTREKTLLFRKQDWYSQRLYEVPDRWMVPLVEHLKAQGYVPTYADVCSLTELTDAQIAGLNSLSDFACRSDQKETGGVRQLLAIFKAAS